MEQRIQGKYSETEEAILDYLYESPGVSTGTAHLLGILRPSKAPSSLDTATVEARKKEL
jgi:hypothetical protein